MSTSNTNYSSSIGIKSEPLDQPMDQQASTSQVIEPEPVFILEAKVRDTIVSTMTEASSILQGDETVEKNLVETHIDLLLTALSGLKFGNDTNSRPSIGKKDKSRLVFDLTMEQRMRIINQLVYIKTYAISNSASNQIKSGLILENQNLINLLLSGLPFKKVQYSNPAQQNIVNQSSVNLPAKRASSSNSTNDSKSSKVSKSSDGSKCSTCSKSTNSSNNSNVSNGSNSSIPSQLSWSLARTEARFTWKFKNVRSLFNDEATTFTSKFFYCQLIPWSIIIQPTKEDGKSYMGAFLQCECKTGSDLPFSCKTSYELRLLNTTSGADPDKDKTVNSNYEFKKIEGYGGRKLISYDELMKESNGYVRGDAIFVQVHLKAETIRFG